MPSAKAKATYREKNREKLRLASIARYEANRERHQAVCRAWAKNNRGTHLAWRALRRAKTLKATLSGYEDQLRDVYKARLEGEEVDHIVPLVNPLVCGLHVPWNLQRIESDANRKKSNRFDPNDPLQGSLAYS